MLKNYQGNNFILINSLADKGSDPQRGTHLDIFAYVHKTKWKLPPVNIRICDAKKEGRANARNVFVTKGEQPKRIKSELSLAGLGEYAA